MARNPQGPEPPPADARNSEADFTTLWRPDSQTGAARGPERVLLDSGVITVDQLRRALELQQEHPKKSILDLLVTEGVISRTTAQQAVAAYFELPFLTLSASDVDPDLFELLPAEFIKSKLVIPICRKDDTIIVGISDPADIFLIDDVKRRLRKSLRLVVTPPEDILQAVEELSVGPGQQVDEIIADIAEDAVEVVEKDTEDITDLEKIAGESPVIRYVNYLISNAVKEGASDIHIEPGERRLRVRCRIDGVLFEQQAPPIQMHAAIISRLKIMANLDIAERRLPQDGRIRATVHGRTVDLRVSTLPVVHGEKCVIRILDNRSIMVGLENLGMNAQTLGAFRDAILQPYGIVLVTGPTGSGKSTTLYSALQVMDGDKLNISTVEDPVEYELDFVNQVHVHEGIGMSFSAALRSLLRQDPDVIMLGEIRDAETARIAIQASLTGHLVLSTLHTNDAPSSITRLVNIGVEPFLISAAVNAVLAQRLVRRICTNCKRPVEHLPDRVKTYLAKHGIEDAKLYQGAGCDRCRQTGYKGRVGIYELLMINEDLRRIIGSSPSLNELRDAAGAAGMVDLQSDGLDKVAAGLTTVEEIMRVTES